MHELYIAESIIRSVKQSLPEEVAPDQVREACVECGKLDAVVPETLEFMFDSVKSESGLPNATLLIKEIPLLCRCDDCAHEFGLDLPIFVCPECRGGGVTVLQGRGIRLVKIKATDPEGD